jgi:hypothetical protein
MRKTSLLFVFSSIGVATALGFAQPSDAGSGPGPMSRMVMASTAALRSGPYIRCKTFLSWTGGRGNDPGHGLGEGGVSFRRDNQMVRVTTDRAAGTYFAYALAFMPGAAADTYIATFEPAGDVSWMLGRFQRNHQHQQFSALHNTTSLTLIPPPKYPAPQTVHDGDVIELDLMVSADGKQRLTDYIEILSHQPVPPEPKPTGEPRDFTVDDGPLTIDAENFVIQNPGAHWQGTGFTEKPGATFWIVFPGEGRYILSLVPHEGFTKQGVIRDNEIAVSTGSGEFTLRFMGPIAGAGKSWNLYVKHEAGYVPKKGTENMATIGIDRLENLLN